MNKNQLISSAVALLKENNIKKKIANRREVFRVTQESNGDSAFFTVNQKESEVMYSYTDVQNIFNAILCLIEDSLSKGESLNIYGFGSFEMKYNKKKRVKDPYEGKWYDIPACYRPRFRPGRNLLASGRAYEVMLNEQDPDNYLPPPVDEDEE